MNPKKTRKWHRAAGFGEEILTHDFSKTKHNPTNWPATFSPKIAKTENFVRRSQRRCYRSADGCGLVMKSVHVHKGGTAINTAVYPSALYVVSRYNIHTLI